ncbi:AtpZ/AtpI family protein [Methylocystis sp. ATCC 49242]|uniref:AtpZ/AtpI family protein n=1 Tax=Methylocystis sp. ATCC 49242 TaxID=622637 RepID=UPI0001F883F8|nr:AtpZ/AtpI family protein [Methylocystis sp. ATCC 49242]
MSDEEKENAEQAALNARLERLAAELRKREQEQSAQEAPVERRGLSRALSVGLNAFSEFVAAVVVGGFLGWKADEWLGTGPWLLLLLLGVGVAAGFWNIYRLAKPKGGAGEDS